MKRFCLLLLVAVSSLFAVAQTTKPHLNHVALTVIDLAKSKTFYTAVIGLDTIPEPFHDGRHVWLSIGDKSQLHLIQNPPPVVVPLKGTHICFSIKNMTAFIAALDKYKVVYEDWPGKRSSVTTRADGVHQIYFQDPDGYWIEINDDSQ